MGDEYDTAGKEVVPAEEFEKVQEEIDRVQREIEQKRLKKVRNLVWVLVAKLMRMFAG